MNWSKAKTILIAALIITDIFLIVTYMDFGFDDEEFSDYEALSGFLAQKNIFVAENTIPERSKDMPVLFVQSDNLDYDWFVKTVSESYSQRIENGEDEDYAQITGQLLKEAGPAYDTAVFERVERSGGYARAIYKNAIDGVAVEKSHIAFVFVDGDLCDFECDWLAAVNFHNRKQRTISAAQALLLFMAQLDEAEAVYIDGIEMIYWLDEESLDSETAVSADTALPTWKIAYNGGKVSYIDGYEH